MKNLIVLLTLLLVFTSCEKDEVNEAQETALTSKILGEWQMFRFEYVESTLDEWTGTEWTRKDEWFRVIRNNSLIILEYREDSTFVLRYGDVETHNGIWGELNDGRFFFDFADAPNNERDGLTERRFVTFYCDNTYSVQIEGDKKSIEYYKITGTTECSEKITYLVND